MGEIAPPGGIAVHVHKTFIQHVNGASLADNLSFTPLHKPLFQARGTYVRANYWAFWAPNQSLFWAVKSPLVHQKCCHRLLKPPLVWVADG